MRVWPEYDLSKNKNPFFDRSYFQFFGSQFTVLFSGSPFYMPPFQYSVPEFIVYRCTNCIPARNIETVFTWPADQHGDEYEEEEEDEDGEGDGNVAPPVVQPQLLGVHLQEHGLNINTDFWPKICLKLNVLTNYLTLLPSNSMF